MGRAALHRRLLLALTCACLVNTSMATQAPFGASIMGESALIDKESGRVFWEGGTSSTLAESLMPKLDQYGVLEYCKPAVLTGMLTLGAIGIVGMLTRKIVEESLQAACGNASAGAPLLTMLWTRLKCMVLWIFLCFPRIENKWLILSSACLYFFEAFTCDTRIRLCNAVSSPDGLEAYMDALRDELPEVKWNVRAYHYEHRKILSPRTYFNFFRNFSKTNDIRLPPATAAPMFPLTKKVISHKASATYDYKSVEDGTMAGMWRRSTSTREQTAPFSKITLTKLLILADEKTREDYFKQQSAFVAEHGRGDEFFEFSTNIEVPGFKRKMLAIRGDIPKRFNFFWFFTCIGLTIPYRIWLSRRCDELRVSVIKETSCDPPISSPPRRSWLSSWIPYSSSRIESGFDEDGKNTSAQSGSFRSFMDGLSLFPSTATTDSKDFESEPDEVASACEIPLLELEDVPDSLNEANQKSPIDINYSDK